MAMINSITLFRQSLLSALFCFLALFPENLYSQNFQAPYNVSALFNNDIVPIVDVLWDHSATGNFQYYNIERDGIIVGTSTIPFYSESVPCFCTYCYRIIAVYSDGISEPSEPGCTFDSVALMAISPQELEVWLLPDEQDTAFLSITNNGGEPLQFDFIDYSSGPPPSGFITAVEPPTDTLPSADSTAVSISFDASGYSPGNYEQYLIYESNDPYHLTDSILCILYVDSTTTGIPLPFYEDWSNGNQSGFWTLEGNWTINTQQGNPEPGSEFTWDPVLVNYQAALLSGHYNGVSKDTQDDLYEDGQFILSFDIKLDDVSSTGDENLIVDVWDESDWNTVMELDNSGGSIEWQTAEADITEFAMGYMFRIRFMAEGIMSTDIVSWFVDNIEIYHFCAPPENLDWEPVAIDTVVMYWSPPPITAKTSSVLGYNLYKKKDNEPFSFLDFVNDTIYEYQLMGYGDYYFYVTALYESCESDTSNMINIQYPAPWGFDESVQKFNIKILPNPSSDQFHIQSTERMKQISITDIRGYPLRDYKVQGRKYFSIEVSTLESGLYLLIVDAEKKRIVKKVLVE